MPCCRLACSCRPVEVGLPPRSQHKVSMKAKARYAGSVGRLWQHFQCRTENESQGCCDHRIQDEFLLHMVVPLWWFVNLIRVVLGVALLWRLSRLLQQGGDRGGRLGITHLPHVAGHGTLGILLRSHHAASLPLICFLRIKVAALGAR